MNEIQNIDTLTTEILILKQQTAQNIIEIGKRLVTVKESLPHGQWGKWLEEKVDFHQATATRFMRVAKEYPNFAALQNLGSSKIFALLDIPQEEREEFISTPHEIDGQPKNIDEMTTRELQKAIKERDKAINEKEIYSSAMKKAEGLQFISDNLLRESKEAAKADIKKLKDSLKEEKKKSSEEIAKLQTFIGEAKASGNDEEVDALQALLKEAQSDLDSSALKVDELEEQLKSKPVDVITAEPVVIEKVPEDIQKELEEYRNNSNQNTTQPVIRFKIYFEELNNIFRNELEVMDEIKKDYPEMHVKCKKAISNLIAQMSERL